MEETMQEMIKCSECGATAHVTVINAKGREWYELAPGWKAADTYPPGDDGIQFACPACLPEVAEGEDQRLREAVANHDPEIILYDGLDAACIGIYQRCGQPAVAAYHYDLCINTFMSQGMTREQAEEWMSYNVEGGWIGERTPAVIHKVEETP
jgi:hypothetical protein